MKGFRIEGKRKYKLIEEINLVLLALKLKGINGAAYIKEKYKLKKFKHMGNEITTKRMTGVLSDLKELL